MKFTLNFKSDNYGNKVIDEPFGMDGIKFSLKQKTDGGGMARDISFSGGEIEFEFTHLRNHELKQILFYHRKYGFEAEVVLTIEIDENNSYTADLDFATATTDDLEYFRCKAIENNKLQIIKSRKDVKVNLLSDLDLDGNYIGALVPERILLLAKPVFQNSEWSRANDIQETFVGYGQDEMRVSLVDSIDKSNIENTLTPFDSVSLLPSFYSQQQSADSFDSIPIIEAQSNLSNLTISISGLNLNITATTGFYTINSLYLAYSNTWLPSETQVVKLEQSSDTLNIVNKDYNIEINNVIRGSRIVLYASIFQPFPTPAATPVSSTSITMSITGSVKASVESIAYNSVSQSLRLVDVMSQVIKSISGLSINAPRFESLGQFYDNRLVDGNFLRGINDKAFSVSLKDIEDSMPEFKGDYEIGSDGKIFFGIESDYYKPVQSGFFDNTQFASMNKTFNPKYSVNEFGLKYKNYQSLKEGEELNSADTIHGESKFVFFNKNVENKKEAEIEWTRDAFLIEATRRKSLEITEATASQEDDSLFCIDSVATTFNNEFTEVTELQHTFDSASNRILLKNDGSVNFISLGIIINSIFRIQPQDANAGTYRVFNVTQNSLELTRLLGVNSSIGDGSRPTKYTYELSKEYVPFTNYTNQGFSETKNLNAADSYSNRRYSIARNVREYWNSYLATCNLYWKDKELKNTWYKNNGKYSAKYNEVTLVEDENFIPTNPILTPILYNDIVFANVEFEDFIALQNSIRSQRGYIRSIDNNERVIKIFPIDMEYSLLEKELMIKGEEKFEPISMTISTQFQYILVNSETRLGFLDYEILNEKLYLYDTNRFRLYNGVYWFEVSVNGAIPKSIAQLTEWLNLVN
jgi:hypothetical protein